MTRFEPLERSNRPGPSVRGRRAALTALCLLLVAGNAQTSEAAERTRIVVSIQPLALILDELAGDRVDVHVLVPPGASPHAFEPRPSDMVRIARAHAFVSVGGGIDDWAVRLATSAGDGLTIHSLFSLLGREEARHDGHAHHEHGENDPHLWLDPLQVRDAIAPALATALIATDPAGEPDYRAHLAAFRDTLEELDREIAEILSAEASPSRDYLAFHDAWHHFAAHYGLHEVAVVEEAAGEQPTPREFAGLLRGARKAGVGAVLIEPQFDPRLAETLGASFGGTTVLVDPLGDPNDEARSTYAGLLRFNARAFRVALDANRTPAP
ncbi:MAG: metal ABC transporter substrate-binding protein [Myxococcota bacterium]|nr:metal ABC transporter substrate-binding protein [Myxococcota bacterium]